MDAVLADDERRIICRYSAATEGGSRAEIVGQLAGIARSLSLRGGADHGQLRAAGVGIPGVVDTRDLRVRQCWNVPGLEGHGLRRDLQQALGVKIVLANDVNAAAVGEGSRGAASGAGIFAFLAVGTSVGLGVIIDGHLFTGRSGSAGEVARLPVGMTFAECRSLGPAPLDRRLSGLALHALTLGHGPRGADEHRGADENATRAHRIDPSPADRRPPARAIAIVARHAAMAAVGVQAVLDPEMIVLGGGLGADPGFVAATLAALRALPDGRTVNLRPTDLGTDAGALGALELAGQTLEQAPWRERRAGSVGSAGGLDAASGPRETWGKPCS